MHVFRARLLSHNSTAFGVALKAHPQTVEGNGQKDSDLTHKIEMGPYEA